MHQPLSSFFLLLFRFSIYIIIQLKRQARQSFHFHKLHGDTHQYTYNNTNKTSSQCSPPKEPCTKYPSSKATELSLLPSQAPLRNISSRKIETFSESRMPLIKDSTGWPNLSCRPFPKRNKLLSAPEPSDLIGISFQVLHPFSTWWTLTSPR